MKKPAQLTSKIIYSLLGLFLVVGLWLLLREKPVNVDTASVSRGDFEENLRVDGTIKSKTKITVVARATGDLDRVDLKVGQTIKKGDVITSLKWDYREAIKSPMTGVISKVYRESAGPINRGEAIVDIIDPEDLQIEAEVLTTDAVKISEGASVKITGVGTEKNLEGTVSRISRAGFMKLSALGIEEEKTLVYVQITNPPKNQLGDNFHVELLINIFRDHNVLKIPLGALFKNQKEWAVYTISGKKAHLRNITIAKRNESEALVTGGVNEGDQVILFPGDQISEGTSVRPSR